MFGNFFGKGTNGSVPDKPLEAKANEYPKARATGTATALPTWTYLIIFETEKKRTVSIPTKDWKCYNTPIKISGLKKEIMHNESKWLSKFLQ